MIYTCTNENCSNTDKTPYNLKFKTESILDENNLGAFFCPHCQQILEKAKSGTLSTAAWSPVSSNRTIMGRSGYIPGICPFYFCRD